MILSTVALVVAVCFTSQSVALSPPDDGVIQLPFRCPIPLCAALDECEFGTETSTFQSNGQTCPGCPRCKEEPVCPVVDCAPVRCPKGRIGPGFFEFQGRRCPGCPKCEEEEICPPLPPCARPLCRNPKQSYKHLANGKRCPVGCPSCPACPKLKCPKTFNNNFCRWGARNFSWKNGRRCPACPSRCLPVRTY